MKLKLEELIPNTYYCFVETDNSISYIKFTKYDKNDIYSSGFQLYEFYTPYNGSINRRYIKNENDFYCTISFYNSCKDVFKIDLEIFVVYLPDTNIDKKHYLRSIKINSLLNK